MNVTVCGYLFSIKYMDPRTVDRRGRMTKLQFNQLGHPSRSVHIPGIKYMIFSKFKLLFKTFDLMMKAVTRIVILNNSGLLFNVHNINKVLVIHDNPRDYCEQSSDLATRCLPFCAREACAPAYR